MTEFLIFLLILAQLLVLWIGRFQVRYNLKRIDKTFWCFRRFVFVAAGPSMNAFIQIELGQPIYFLKIGFRLVVFLKNDFVRFLLRPIKRAGNVRARLFYNLMSMPRPCQRRIDKFRRSINGLKERFDSV